MKTPVAWGSLFLCGIVATSAWVAPAGAEALPRSRTGSLNSTLWVQTSAEYASCAIQAYRTAAMLLDCGLRDVNWTADPEQQAAGGYASKLPAVILDVDETVLDNSAYRARRLRGALTDAEARDDYELASWRAWIADKVAGAIPGAVGFVKSARERGVRVFFITNRTDEERADSIANLRQAGFAFADSELLTTNAKLGRPSDKVSRRRSVAAGHRVLLLIGDDLNDFIEGTRGVSVEARTAVAHRYREFFGTRWVILPNATYGGWFDALGESPEASLRSR